MASGEHAVGPRAVECRRRAGSVDAPDPGENLTLVHRRVEIDGEVDQPLILADGEAIIRRDVEPDRRADLDRLANVPTRRARTGSDIHFRDSA